ncbi:MAG: diphosphate--fructose-6-phosphate 1-phosphotransferase [Anaerolineae bacterium]|nr:diphosphate--fructose-6-phosphate 1-phosphotransferase [Anaerolineae bacterium]
MSRRGLLVGQAGGSTTVVNACLAGVIIEAQQQAGITHIYGMQNGIFGALHERLVDLTHVSRERLDLVAQTPASTLGASRRALDEQEGARLIAVLKAHDIRMLVYMGGREAMQTCCRVERAAREHAYDLAVVGVPKTAANDLPCTDHTPGYGSAARTLALAVRDAARDLEAMSSVADVVLFEVMGRESGWLAAATTLGRANPDEAPHLLYLPELPFDGDAFLGDVQRQYDERGYVLAAVSEGVYMPGSVPGEPVTAYLAGRVRDALGLRAREIRMDALQRSNTLGVSTTDLVEATLVGREAVRQAVRGAGGQMVTLVRVPAPTYRCTTGAAPLDQIAGAVRTLPAEFIAPGGDVSAAFRAYAEPLLGDPLPPHGRLGGKPISPRLPVY